MSTQLRRFYSWRPNPLVEGTDVFLQGWLELTFANLPWALIPRVLMEVRRQRANIVLIAPVWKSQAWFPFLLTLLTNHPIVLPAVESTILQVNLLPLPIRGHKVQLAAWPISRDCVRQEAFQRRLRDSSYPYGIRNPSYLTTHCFTSGSASVPNRIGIPFLDLWAT